ncbi:hypothetical protein J2129_000764 [Methanofollis sp. W23]|nr:hypothetical protein [Methanofollis sp. W23]
MIMKTEGNRQPIFIRGGPGGPHATWWREKSREFLQGYISHIFQCFFRNQTASRVRKAVRLPDKEQKTTSPYTRALNVRP